MAVAFIPFPASLLGEYPKSQASIIVYGCTLICANIFFRITWFYADRAQLLHPVVSASFRKFALSVTLAPIAVYGLAIAVSFVSLSVPLALFAVVPAFFIIPHPFVSGRVEEAIADEW